MAIIITLPMPVLGKVFLFDIAIFNMEERGHVITSESLVTETGFHPYSVQHACIMKSVNFAVFVLSPKSSLVSFLNILCGNQHSYTSQKEAHTQVNSW